MADARNVRDSPESPNTWGESTWQFLFCVAATYDPKNKADTEALFSSLKGTLPCVLCRTEYTKLWNATPINLTSRAALQTWLLNVCNSVRARLGKPALTAADVKQKYTQRSISETHLTALALVVVAAIVLGLWVVYRRYK